MADRPTFHGWKFTESEDVHGHPVLEATKPGRPTMGEIGEHGIDPQIPMERLRVRLLEYELGDATESERPTWERRLRDARRERDESRAMRVAAETVRLRYESEG